ncbi:Uncharacterised protein [Mycobacteroides abscessus subsp. bolletii]|nr:Uncharacterised protein [Mycobacteroides abscessus subsp. bolletii]SKP61958.1 Uncharacterised protein [Mycobacteroides abscessus subsp. bolletii]SKP73900.1 Uncharacterised protein [Mycobacteroides abscessus subsp. bolletii]SKQ20996.1 Uncharacterised protein [Mycobacteroides abscessus subsp. bolletii]
MRRIMLLLSVAAIGLCGLSAPRARADDPPAPQPYPDISYYDSTDPDLFGIPGQSGVWFMSPTGLTCVIRDRGGFGCTGDIPGAPTGANHIGWFDGDARVHYDWTMAVRFPAGSADRMISPLHTLTYENTTCAVTAETDLYCVRGPFRFLVTPTYTRLNG